MAQFLSIPKVQVSLLLFLIYVSALINNPSVDKIYLLLASLSFCILSDLLFTYIRKRKLFIPFASITTGLIIALIANTGANWFQLAIICAVAMTSKNFIRISNRHIFNPAGFGLFFGGLIFNLPVSWWGVSFQSFQFSVFSLQQLWPFLILISPALVSAYRMKRFVSILSFALTYGLTSQTLTVFTDPTMLFFSFVMLPEPMTSPADYKRQAMYGVVVGVLSYLMSANNFIAELLPDVLIPALLLGNLIFFKFR